MQGPSIKVSRLVRNVPSDAAWMKGTSACAGWFGTIDVEIHHHRILTASDHHSFAELIRQRVDLLMRHVRRHIDKISRTSLLAELELLSPPHSRPSPNNIKHRFKP